MDERRESNIGVTTWRSHLTALVLYIGISWFVIARGASLTDTVLGAGSDPFIFIWFLKWWPYALAQHLDSLWSFELWRPLGVSVLWMTSIPLIAWLAMPFTVWLGPVAVYDLIVMLGPSLSAWFMYRFCLRLVHLPAAAMLAGFLFGFSTYEVAQCSRPNLAFTFLLPCLGWVMLARAQGMFRRRRAVALIAMCVLGQFLISSEIFATTVLFGALAWTVAFACMRDSRATLMLLLVDSAIALPIAAILLSPLLSEMFSNYPFVNLPDFWPSLFVATPGGFILPGPNTLFDWAPANGLINRFPGDEQELATYLGIPLVAIIYLYARQNWRARQVRALTIIIAGLTVLSLGPKLWIGNVETAIPLPWAVLMRLPLFSNALPIRFALFVAFAAATMVALWIKEAAGGGARARRLGAGLLACAAIWPAPARQFAVPSSSFFAPGGVQHAIGQNRQLLILPFGFSGPSSYWQVENNFGFTQTGGYLGFPPRGMQHFAAVWELTAQDPAGIKPADVADFAQGTKADYIVAGPGTPAAEIAVIAQLHWRERKIDDVTIFDVPAAGGTGG
jgi:hypothetical protein